ncbi:MAG: L,D-transpeptidase family protein [Thermoflexales bacterium]|nr:L,D-transpeptidase family protein [Thermoflexales bacterium]
MSFQQVWAFPGRRARSPRRAPAPRRSAWWPWGLVLLVEAWTAVVIVAAAGWFFFYQSQLIMPGVSALGVGLGGRSQAEAAVILQQRWSARTITLQADSRTHAVSPAALGISLDAEATARLAYQRWRSSETLGEADVLPVLRLDRAIAAANLQALAGQFDIPAVNAGLRVVGGRVQTSSPVPGQALDVGSTLAYLERNTAQVAGVGELVLVMRPVQPLIVDASAAAAQAEGLLSGDLLLRAYDPIADERFAWPVALDSWSDWLALSLEPGDPPTLNWGLDGQKVEALLAARAAELGAARYLDSGQAVAAVMDAIAARRGEARLRVYHHPRQHTVQAGETLSSIGRAYGIPYAWIQAANPGVGDGLWAGQALTIPSPDDLLPLPPVENKRIVVSIATQKMWAYENGALKWEWPASTGIAPSPTSPGVFQIQSHEPNAYAANWNLWMPSFMGIYRPAPNVEFMNGFHGFPTRGGSQLLWTSSLGRPVTYGCILISTDNAALLYAWAEEGVVVEIRP